MQIIVNNDAHINVGRIFHLATLPTELKRLSDPTGPSAEFRLKQTEKGYLGETQDK